MILLEKLRLKYYSLSKEEKDKLKNKFYQTKYGKEIKFRLNRLFIIGIIGIIFSIFLILTNKDKWNIVYSIILLCASLLFIYSSFSLRIKKLNDYLTKKSNFN